MQTKTERAHAARHAAAVAARLSRRLAAADRKAANAPESAFLSGKAQADHAAAVAAADREAALATAAFAFLVARSEADKAHAHAARRLVFARASFAEEQAAHARGAPGWEWAANATRSEKHQRGADNACATALRLAAACHAALESWRALSASSR